MKIQIDLKSAICGLVIGIAAMFVVGAGTSNETVGRFQVAGGSGNGDGHFMIIDTATGQDWCYHTAGRALDDIGGSGKKLEN
jgi:hypothetical protein